MIERDYIMRMIAQLTQFLIKIFFYKNKKDYPQAIEEINRAGRQILGVDRIFLHSLPPQQLVEFFGKDKAIDLPKCYVAGMMMKEEADILALQHHDEEATRLRLTALYLLVEIALEYHLSEFENLQPSLDEIINNFHGIELPADLSKKLFQYFEKIKRFDKAEDILYKILENDRAFKKEGVAFYQRLSKLSNQELINSGLPMEEIRDGLAELQRNFGKI